MQISNPFQINNWGFRKFLIIISSIQLALWGSVGLDALGFQIPIIRQLIGLIYLLFVPGISIIRILGHNKLGNNIEIFLYTIGLSIATLMLLGFFLNAIGPILGLNNPLSFFPLIATMSLLVLLLIILNYFADIIFNRSPSYYQQNDFLNTKDLLSPVILFFVLLPIISAFGSCLVTFSHNNIIPIFLLPLLAIIPLLILSSAFPEKLYIYVIFIISISLLGHTTLISNYIWGMDIHQEYHLANLVLANSYWDSTIYSNVNAMLSIVMLAPIFTLLLDMDLTWIFKIVYPFLFSLIPLGLYKIYERQTNHKIAFLSCFFFVAFEFFYFNAPTGGRQEIAELFLVLLFLVMLDTDISRIKRSVLSIIFMFSLIVSHYGTSYIYLLIFISSYVILKIIEYIKQNKKYEEISTTNVLIFITFLLLWYMYISSSSAFITIVNVGDQIISSIVTDFFSIEASHGMSLIVGGNYSLMNTLELYIQLAPQFLIAIGITWTLIMRIRDNTKIIDIFIIFALMAFIIDVAGLVVPYFSSQLNAWRLYHLTLILLAPFGVIGGVKLFDMFSNFTKFNFFRVVDPLKLISIFLAIFLLFNSTWIYGIAHEYPASIRSIALYQKDVNQGDDIAKNAFYAQFYLDQDLYSAKWISENRNKDIKFYSDFTRRLTILHSYGEMPFQSVMTNKTSLNNAYLYLGYPNIKFDLMYGPKSNEYWYLNDIKQTLVDNNLIYDNNVSKIFIGV